MLLLILLMAFRLLKNLIMTLGLALLLLNYWIWLSLGMILRRIVPRDQFLVPMVIMSLSALCAPLFPPEHRRLPPPPLNAPHNPTKHLQPENHKHPALSAHHQPNKAKVAQQLKRNPTNL